MKTALRYGKFRYISFEIVNCLCLAASYYFAAWLYLRNSGINYTDDFVPIVLPMIVIDIGVAALFDTLNLVLRRRIESELLESFKHIGLSFAFLAVVLFSLRQGAQYSRVTIYLAYIIDFVLICVAHFLLRTVLRKKNVKKAVLLMSTDRFAKEGMDFLNNAKREVKYLHLLEIYNGDQLGGVPVIKNSENLPNIICWSQIDTVYIYGIDRQMLPKQLLTACNKMNIRMHLVDFSYKLIDLKTVHAEQPELGALSFLEGKRDVPFPIRRAYWITETQAEQHRGFHAHKLNCQLLFCPYGSIDIILDDGTKKDTVHLNSPGKGLLLMPGLWREMVWKKSGSVLCVLASEYYDEKEYIRNYDEFISYHREYDGMYVIE